MENYTLTYVLRNNLIHIFIIHVLQLIVSSHVQLVSMLGFCEFCFQWLPCESKASIKNKS